MQNRLGSLFCILVLTVAGAGYSRAAASQSVAPQSASGAHSAATGDIDEQSLVVLPGHVHPSAIARFDRGAVADSASLQHMVLVLKRSAEQEQALITLIDQLHDAKSPMYHRWLTPEEFGQFFGPSDQDVQTLTNWLEEKGFKIDEVSPGKTTLIFSGNAAQFRRAFRTQMHNFLVYGVGHVANISDPQIPAALAPLVAGFRSLNDFQAQPLHHLVGGFTRDKSTGSRARPSPQA